MLNINSITFCLFYTKFVWIIEFKLLALYYVTLIYHIHINYVFENKYMNNNVVVSSSTSEIWIKSEYEL